MSLEGILECLPGNKKDQVQDIKINKNQYPNQYKPLQEPNKGILSFFYHEQQQTGKADFIEII